MPDEKELINSAQLDSDMAALSASTDGSVPAELKRLIGQSGDGWEFTAVTPGTQRSYVPDGPLAPGQSKLDWSFARLSGKPFTPPAIERVEDGYYIRVIGNAVAAEAWLRSQGWHAAMAGSPNAIWLGSHCPGTMRLGAHDLYRCDHCDYVSLDR